MRLIDADDAIRKMESTMDMQDLYLPIHFKELVIDECPTIDAVPVRHVEWCGEADGYADGELVYDMWYCPFCGKRFEEWDEKPNWNYCPNCGARMGGLDETD